jgi:tetratricopeptide (TPR) repeat protein
MCGFVRYWRRWVSHAYFQVLNLCSLLLSKSEIAIEYCYQFHEMNPQSSVFWVATDTVSKFEQAYANIARKLSLPQWEDPKTDHLPLVANYLANKFQRPWIMVLDNADDLHMLTKPPRETHSAALASFVPRSFLGQIIITTRDAHVGHVITQGKAPIDVHSLSIEDAESLFCSNLLYESEPNEKVLQQIVSILDCLPLAITQATAYINWNRISIDQYLAELSESDTALQALLSEDQYDMRRGFDRINSVVRSWKLSFDAIELKYSRAARLLCVMALLNRQNIPRDLLWRGDESQQHLTTALGILQSFSLIKSEHGSNTYSMHRLVQFVTCIWQKMQGTKAIHQQEALALVVAKFPESEKWGESDSKKRRLCQLFLPHAQAVQQYASNEKASQLALAMLKFNMSSFEFQSGHYVAARELCDSACQIREVNLGLGHLDTLQAAGLLGTILMCQGLYNEAESIQESTLKRKQDLLGTDHIDTIESASDLIDISVRRGEFQKAEELAKNVLALRRKLLGEEHCKTISSIRTCAYIAMQWGRYEEAEVLAQQALEQNKLVLGFEHPVTIACRGLLVSILENLGRYQEAIILGDETFQLREKVLGSKHPHTLNAINNLARLRRITGEFELSESLYRDAMLHLESIVGPENPDTLACASNLAVVLRDRGKFEEAEALSRQTLEKRERILGAENPRTMITLNEFARLLDKMGRLEEAESCASRALATRKKVLGEAHPETLNSKSTLALIWMHKGDSGPAKHLLEEALKIRLEKQRPDHPDVLADQYELANIIEKGSLQVEG